MMQAQTFNILMYSHDTYGLGHIRRTMAIASHLAGPGVNVIIITGSPLAGRFDTPPGVDFVRIPGMIKQTNDEYLPQSIRINARHALNIRKNIIVATAKAFAPRLFIVDKAPLGLKREVVPALKWLKRRMPGSKAVLGLRDVMDDAESTRRDWREKGVYEVLDRYYSEIWVYGNREFYDPVTEYAIEPEVSAKLRFTGYIQRSRLLGAKMAELREDERLAPREKVVVVTTGGGGDGYPLMDAYLEMLESLGEPPFRSILVSGPFMPKAQREEVHARAQGVKARFHHFFRRMEALIGLADVVVCMGGYNTLCEVLSQGKASLVVPREEPRLEQRIRAEVMARHGLLEFLPWADLGPGPLARGVFRLLDEGAAMRQTVRNFKLTGLDVISRRVNALREAQP